MTNHFCQATVNNNHNSLLIFTLKAWQQREGLYNIIQSPDGERIQIVEYDIVYQTFIQYGAPVLPDRKVRQWREWWAALFLYPSLITDQSDPTWF